MITGYIRRQVEQLLEQYGQRDPFALCGLLEIEVLYHPLGDKLKGYFFYHSGIRIIVVNRELPEEMQRVVCAHELGHALLHQELASLNAMQELNLFDRSARPELEANLFAAELLIPDEDVISCLNEDTSFFDVAKELYVPAELLDFKFRMLKQKGYRLEAPICSQGDFLKR